MEPNQKADRYPWACCCQPARHRDPPLLLAQQGSAISKGQTPASRTGAHCPAPIRLQTELNSTCVLRNSRGLPSELNMALELSEKIIDGNLCRGIWQAGCDASGRNTGQRSRVSLLFPRTIPKLAALLLHVPGTLRKVKAVHLSSSVPSGDSMSPTRQAFQISRTNSGVGICCRNIQR